MALRPVPAFAMGVLTACFGGIVRDVLAGEPSILMRPELYVTAAALAAGLFVGLTLVGVPIWMAAVVAAVAALRPSRRRDRARLDPARLQGLMHCSIGCMRLGAWTPISTASSACRPTSSPK